MTNLKATGAALAPPARLSGALPPRADSAIIDLEPVSDRRVRTRSSAWLSALRRLLQSDLPAQSYFSIEELLARWKADGLDLSRLIELTEQDALVFCVRLRDLKHIKTRREVPEGTSTKLSWTGLSAPPSVLKAYFLTQRNALQVLTAPAGEEVGLDGYYLDRERDTARSVGLPGIDAPFIRVQDLCVSREELERFEESYRCGQAAPLLLKVGRSSRKLMGLLPWAKEALGAFLGKKGAS